MIIHKKGVVDMEFLITTPIIVFWMFFVMIIVISIQESYLYKRLKNKFKAIVFCRKNHMFVRQYHNNDPVKDTYKCERCNTDIDEK